MKRRQPKTYYDVKGSRARIVVNQGGTRSGKTYSTLQALCEWAHLNRGAGWVISIVRKTLPSLKGSAYRDFLHILNGEGWYSEEHHNKTEMIYALFGNLFEFISVDQPQKIRGRKRNICFINEANELTWEDFFQLNIRTTDKLIVDYNPSDEYHWIYDKLIPRDDAEFHKTTYLDNPFLEQALVEEIERLKDADENYWKVYGLGERGTSSETIYTHWQTCKGLPGKGQTWYGQDFGYNNPSALVRLEMYEGAIYAEEVLYQTKLTTADLIEQYKTLGIPRSTPIYCDAAEPKTIEEIHRAGYNAHPADKDVTEGIRKVKSMPLHITGGSLNLLKEIRSYKWKLDKTGQKLDEPVKFNDHACFVGETMVQTSRGEVPIKDIQPGDYVLTSAGFKRVDKVFNNGWREIYEYWIESANFKAVVRCTPDHLFKVGESWKPISHIQPGEMVNLCSILTVDASPSTRGNATLTAAQKECTSMSGSTSTDLSLRATTFTTGMATPTTMNPQTLNSRKGLNTSANTLKGGSRRTPNGSRSFMPKGLQQHRSGTDQERVQSGIGSMGKAHGHPCPSELGSADSVSRRLSLRPSSSSNFAPTSARVNGGGIKGSTMLSEPVPTAGTYTPSTNTVKGSIAQKAVVSSIHGTYAGKEVVYDLEVADVHEYFANGLLVHNCDALRYAVFTHLAKPKLSWVGF